MDEQGTVRASVIIVSYNSKPDLERCLPSLRASLSNEDELIIVDNASTDTTVDWLKQNYAQIKLICSSANVGYGGGNNIGARSAKGEFLVFLNPDTLVEPRWIDYLIEALTIDNSTGLATSRIMLLNNPEIINTCGNDVHISGITMCRGMNTHGNVYSKQEEVSAVSGTAFIIRKELFSRLGGFDERFFMYMEDTDLSLRARLAGYRCMYVPDSVVYHDYALTIGQLKTYYEERNRYMMLLKCFQPQTLLALLPTLLLAEIVTWGFSIFQDRKNILNKIRAYGWIVSHNKEIMISRKQVQAERKVTDKDILKKANHRLGYEQTSPGHLSHALHSLFDPVFNIFQKFALLF